MWPPELVYVELFQVLEKKLSYSFIYYDPLQAISLLQWVIPEVKQKRLGNSVKNMHFEH